jgi:hypothetical protein
MCNVSAVIAQYTVPNNPYPPLSQWPLDTAYQLREVIARLDALDKKFDAKDCHEPTKDEFLKALEARIAALENRTGP